MILIIALFINVCRRPAKTTRNSRKLNIPRPLLEHPWPYPPSLLTLELMLTGRNVSLLAAAMACWVNSSRSNIVTSLSSPACVFLILDSCNVVSEKLSCNGNWESKKTCEGGMGLIVSNVNILTVCIYCELFSTCWLLQLSHTGPSTDTGTWSLLSFLMEKTEQQLHWEERYLLLQLPSAPVLLFCSAFTSCSSHWSSSTFTALTPMCMCPERVQLLLTIKFTTTNV